MSDLETQDFSLLTATVSSYSMLDQMSGYDALEKEVFNYAAGWI
jgi:hypothetical protein